MRKSKSFHCIRVILFAVVLATTTQSSAFAAGLDVLIKQADAAYDARNFAGALKLYEKVLESDPNHKYALSVAAMSARVLKDHRTAVKYLERLRPIAKSSVKLRQDLLLEYAMLGDDANRARIRAEFKKLWRRSNDKKKEPIFISDVFDVNGWNVWVNEYIELKNPKYIRYVFLARDKADEDRGWITRLSLGSYDRTNSIDKEMHPKRPFDRLFHLDAYPMRDTKVTHQTIGFFGDEPGYPTVKEMVLVYLRQVPPRDYPKRLPATPSSLRKN